VCDDNFPRRHVDAQGLETAGVVPAGSRGVVWLQDAALSIKTAGRESAAYAECVARLSILRVHAATRSGHSAHLKDKYIHPSNFIEHIRISDNTCSTVVLRRDRCDGVVGEYLAFAFTPSTCTTR
jgi:hypothetical protein